MKKYLTEREIYKIHSRSKNIYFEYTDENDLPREKTIHTEIFAYSPKNRLILIKGNEDTGHLHIRLRHNYWSIRPYIINDVNKGKKFQRQSRFPMNTGMREELKIADSVYLPENLLTDNDHPESHLFDVYLGEHETENGKKEKVKLILYKDTKIIHTLFLVSDRYAKKKVKGFPFSREKIQIRPYSSENRKEIFIPYIDTQKKLVYGIVINKLFDENIEIIKLIIICDDDKYSKEIILGQRNLIDFKSQKSEEITYQHTNLREFERLILKIENGIKNGEVKLNGVTR